MRKGPYWNLLCLLSPQPILNALSVVYLWVRRISRFGVSHGYCRWNRIVDRTANAKTANPKVKCG